ncbi:MAG TPA: DNA repair protein RecO [Ignavibacteriaceae bacterium]|nr:DNA repair protein RecO [Ignavibacteriaceae bacterium]
MSDIIKTEAVVLSKINYGDTSSIISLYSKSDGKISAIVKGGRGPKSKIGKMIDPLNYLQIIIYKKNTREVQILSNADLISHFPKIKEDLESTKYAFAIIELIKNLTVENESNHKLFKGLIKILNLIEEKKEQPAVLFDRFFLFFLSELGYDLAIDKCGICGKQNSSNSQLGFDLELGFVCQDCLISHIGLENISAELFNYLFCLKFNKKIEKVEVENIEKLNQLLERYLKFHIPDFKGIQSLQIFK